jgi:NAD(P)-dependent dehydrogenase (short-subunit alcohol dehydrogenase family)
VKSVVVTGVSTGIGRACVKVLAANGFRVFGSVLESVDANRLLQEFGENFSPLVFDVTDRTAVAASARQVETALRGETLLGLVNNAGIAVPGPLLYLRMEDFERQIAVNLAGHLVVTQAFAPFLGLDRSLKGPPGRIVMITSVGGKNALPLLGAYCASKFALEGMSESLRRELMPFGIDVIIIAPGTVATPIFNQAYDLAQFATTPYASALPTLKSYMASGVRKGLPPEKIGEAVMTALTVSKPKTRYTVMRDPIKKIVAHVLPTRILDKILARRMGLI